MRSSIFSNTQEQFLANNNFSRVLLLHSRVRVDI